VKEFQSGGRDLKERMARRIQHGQIQQESAAAALRAETAKSYRETKELKLKADRIRNRLLAAIEAYQTVVALHNSVDPSNVIEPETFIVELEDDTVRLDQEEVERLNNNKRNRQLAQEFKERAHKKAKTVDEDSNKGNTTDTVQDEA
jgi:hypothetical protein